jgi:hypothetical protein
VQFLAAVTLMAALGARTRCATPRHLMSYLGRVPREHSSGERRRQGSSTKTGNSPARRVLGEGAWAYRSPAKVSRHVPLRLEKVPKAIQDLSWKAQVRLCKRYRRLVARGKQVNHVVVAIARERAACVWALARAVKVVHSAPQKGKGVDGNTFITSSEQQKRRRPGVVQPSLHVMRLEQTLVPRAEAGTRRPQGRG